MTFRQITAALALLLLATAAPAAAQTPPAATLVPADFTVPTLATGPGFKLVPLGPAVVKIDYDAYMASIEHLHKTFTRSTDWPHAGLTAADAMKDMEGEQARFQARQSFAYAVLTPDGTRERGSVYVAPSRVAGYDAVVRLWVTKAEYDAGFDAQLYAWVQTWLRTTWPFTRIAYPGRAIDWATWDGLVAKAKK
ncbi:twin-arginine translocation pathway signal protein [Sandarakinorhabdus sp.]|uniref:twin-arginine translocation pathway signal protein n=1 Tax=Sandarakinorhabdus sp. TaxID=1916663 RepID=UPI0033406A19